MKHILILSEIMDFFLGLNIAIWDNVCTQLN